MDRAARLHRRLLRTEREALLPGIAAGGTTATLAWVEDNGRWDAEGTSLTATAESDEIVLNGHKSYVIDGHTADLIVVLARAPQGLSLFTVAMAPSHPRPNPTPNVGSVSRQPKAPESVASRLHIGGIAPVERDDFHAGK